MEKTVLVTGVTGTIGRDVVKLLSKNAVPVRAGVRDQTKARKQFGTDIALATFDFEDAASFPRCAERRRKSFPPAAANAESSGSGKCICRCSEAHGRASHCKTVRDRRRCQPTIHVWEMARRCGSTHSRIRSRLHILAAEFLHAKFHELLFTSRWHDLSAVGKWKGELC